MLNINTVALTGRLTRDAESPSTKSGTLLTKFTIAVNNPRKDKDGNWHNDSAFIDCTAFGYAAERAIDLLKGQTVYVEGRLMQENWEKDGQKRSKLSVTVSTVKPFKTSKKDPDEEFDATGQQPVKDLWTGEEAGDDEVPF